MTFLSYEELRRKLLTLLHEKNYREIALLIRDTNEVDIAEFLGECDEKERALLFRMLPKDMAAEVFANLDAEDVETLIHDYSDKEVAELVDGLYNDDLADLMEELPASVARRVLAATDPERRKLVNKLLAYPEDSAGAMMTTEFVHLRQKMTVIEALTRLRKVSTRTEMIYTCFVTSESRILEGVITVRELLQARDESTLAEIMETNVLSVTTQADKEQVARMFDRYDLLAIPVVDSENRLVGIVTVDDAVDVLIEESTEDVTIMAAVRPTEKPYLETTVWDNCKRRVVWLLLLMFSGMINGSILERFEHAFVALPILVTFMPMVTDTGGNAGSQSSTLLIRGIALGEIRLRNLGQVLLKELGIGLSVGSILALANGLRIYLMNGHDLLLAATVSAALLAVVVAANLIGGMLPLIAKSLKLDPAIMASPLITTIVDALGLVLYFEIASALMPGLRL